MSVNRTARIAHVNFEQYRAETSKPQYKYLYNRIEVLRITQRLMDMVLDGWTCVISKDILVDYDGTQISGICVEHVKIIVFAGNVFLSRDWLETVNHEIAHALTPNDHTHGPEFRHMYDLLSVAPVYEYEYGELLDQNAYIVLKNTNAAAKTGPIHTNHNYAKFFWFEEHARQIDNALQNLDLLDFIQTLCGQNDLVFVYFGEFVLTERANAPLMQHFEIIFHQRYSHIQFDVHTDVFDNAQADPYVVRARLGIELSPNVDDLTEIYIDRAADAGAADVEPLPLDWEMSEASEANRNLRKR